MTYFCCDKPRRTEVLNHSFLNGIDYLEILDDTSLPHHGQNFLILYLLKPLGTTSLEVQNIRITGGERIRNISVKGVSLYTDSSVTLPSPPESPDKVIVIEVSEPGDFSTYTLNLIRDHKDLRPPETFDLVLSCVDFSFKVLCPDDFDCRQDIECAKEPAQAPEINYLAKDYASFRQLMLDRISLLQPKWKDRNAADLGITLIELIAYAADHLSYRQDAIATEAYLGTARRRISVRRHARLIDYHMHDGCNARTWIQIKVNAGTKNLLLEKGEGGNKTKFVTSIEGLPAVIKPDSPEFQKSLTSKAQFFELMEDLMLNAEHNDMMFYTWGDKECCLPKGATKATLQNHFPDLHPGQVLIFAEALGPITGKASDADPGKRHAVRLTKVKLHHDPVSLNSPPEAPADEQGIPVTEIEWNAEDALPFPFCISSRVGTEYFDNVSVAHGNIALVDHGITFEDNGESSLIPDKVPDPGVIGVSSSTSNCDEVREVVLPVRYRPKLKQKAVTQTAPFPFTTPSVPASAIYKWSMNSVRPAIKLFEHHSFAGKIEWIARRDLINSAANAKEFVLEIETDGTAQIRFGDNKNGLMPSAGTRFSVCYRIGNGTKGNIGANTLTHIITDHPVITVNPIIETICNPLPAKGGMEPESIELVKQNAPQAFRIQERAVTADDYEEMAARCDSSVQQAACNFRWTGSWRTAFVTVDRVGGRDISSDFQSDMRSCLERYRMAGQDLKVNEPVYVALEIEMIICVKPEYIAEQVKRALLEKFSNRKMPDGSLGVFHPDNFTFGQTVYLSPLYAAAHKTAGVHSVKVVKFRRKGDTDTKTLEAGKITLESLEIARLDNDPNFRERGVFNLIMEGGR